MSTNKKNKKQNAVREIDAEVLYQKLGDRWFAFSLIGDEVFMSPISDEVINDIKQEANANPPIRTRETDEAV